MQTPRQFGMPVHHSPKSEEDSELSQKVSAVAALVEPGAARSEATRAVLAALEKSALMAAVVVATPTADKMVVLEDLVMVVETTAPSRPQSLPLIPAPRPKHVGRNPHSQCQESSLS